MKELALLPFFICFLVLMSGCGDETTRPSDSAESDVQITGSRGNTDGRFVDPRAAALDIERGWMYVVDITGRIQKFTLEGKFLLSWYMPEYEVGKPTGLAIDHEGNLLVADTHYNRVVRFSPTGELMAQWGSYGTGPGQFVSARDVVVDREGMVYVCEMGATDRIQKFSFDGTFIMQWGSRGTGEGEFQRPMGMAIDADGVIYVSDSVNHRIQKFTTTGEFLGSFGEVGSAPGQMRYPYDVAVGPKGNIYVCEYGNHRVQVFTKEGKSIGIWGTVGRDVGQLTSPWGIEVDNNGFGYVVDRRNHRVQRFRR